MKDLERCHSAEFKDNNAVEWWAFLKLFDEKIVALPVKQAIFIKPSIARLLGYIMLLYLKFLLLFGYITS